MIRTFAVIFWVSFVLLCLSAQALIQKETPFSDCPDIFSYHDDSERYSGKITIPSEFLNDTNLITQVQLSYPGIISTKDKGRLRRAVQYNSNITAVVSPIYHIEFLKGQGLPRIRRIAVNGKVLCRAKGYPAPQTLVRLEHVFSSSTSVPQHIRNRRQADFLDQKSVDKICGPLMRPVRRDLNDATLRRSEMPWLSSIHEKKKSALEFLCVGTLIYPRIVISAAHCFTKEGTTVRADKLLVTLGRHDLNENNERGSVTRDVSNLVVHPEYLVSEEPNVDLAVVYLNSPVEFTDYIKPICLWSYDEVPQMPIETGYVVGWSGLNGRKIIPRAYGVRRITDEVCTQKEITYSRKLLEHTFCGEKLGSSAPCLGESGGPLMTIRGDRWVLRGIITNYHYRRQSNCDKTEVMLFCDVVKHLGWVTAVRSYDQSSGLDSRITQDMSQDIDETCGKENIGLIPYIFGGTVLTRAQYPWLTAIYEKTATGLGFICGGSLITAHTVVSAAHCFNHSYILPASRVLVYLGRHNLQEYNEEGMVARDIRDIVVHPDYDFNKFSDADVAVVQLQLPVEFTHYIRPICLWKDSTELKDIENTLGSVAGWGGDETGASVTAVPKVVSGKIVNSLDCVRTLPSYAQLLTRRSFCAGNRDNTGPCMGDSGGGLMINRDDRWYLRGIVSAGPKKGQKCDLSGYVVFCDVAQHLDWLKTNAKF